jgi:hypothetical protein
MIEVYSSGIHFFPNVLCVVLSVSFYLLFAYICGYKTNAYNILIGKIEGGDNFEDLGIDGKIILKIVRKEGGRLWS